ncbi:hypothetical protein KP509_10G013800 [Ceratopteris richardii]|uniref:Uncharacterized protein n=1 Tax=Ceratopteris richardii TaxID=49495 RepID=A0A8T2TZB3_CERRI|nr:hypothetical protein KP509_10G013800 [Ceratopteris richardii]KAH7426714.1 hypothetical protein KP509_10G013800 [Ceratopteris richardii]
MQCSAVPSSNLESSDLEALETAVNDETVPDRQFSFSQGDEHAARSSQTYALLQHLSQNKKIRSAISSLATDPALQTAVLQNKELRELSQKLKGGYEIAHLESSSVIEEPEVSTFRSFTRKAFCFTGKVLLVAACAVVGVAGVLLIANAKHDKNEENEE